MVFCTCLNGDGGNEAYCCGKPTPVFLNARPSTETRAAYFTKKSELFQRCDKALNGDRPQDLLKAEVVLRHSSLAEQAAQKVKKWLAGTRDFTSVVPVPTRHGRGRDEHLSSDKTSKTFEHRDLDECD